MATTCPKCHAPIELPPGVSPYEDHPFKPDDVVVCEHCAEILIYDGQSEPHVVTKEQIAELQTIGRWHGIKRHQSAVKTFLHDQKTHQKKT